MQCMTQAYPAGSSSACAHPDVKLHIRRVYKLPAVLARLPPYANRAHVSPNYSF